MAQLIVVVALVLAMIGLGDVSNEYTKMQIGAIVQHELELVEVRVLCATL